MPDCMHLKHPREDFIGTAVCSPWERNRENITEDWDAVTCEGCLKTMGRSTSMAVKQPDPRIHVKDLGKFYHDGKLYVSHGRPGCPANALVEEFDGYLRCWACHTPLTDEAAAHVRENCTPGGKNKFMYSEE